MNEFVLIALIEVGGVEPVVVSSYPATVTVSRSYISLRVGLLLSASYADNV